MAQNESHKIEGRNKGWKKTSKENTKMGLGDKSSNSSVIPYILFSQFVLIIGVHGFWLWIKVTGEAPGNSGEVLRLATLRSPSAADPGEAPGIRLRQGRRGKPGIDPSPKKTSKDG